MVVLAIIAGLISFIIAAFTFYWATDFVESTKRIEFNGPHVEFAIRQMTAAAWTFSLLSVSCFIFASIAYSFDPDFEPEIEIEEPEIKTTKD